MRAPSLYVHVDNEDAIYDAMFAQGYQELLSRLETVERTDDPAQDLRRDAHLFSDFCVEDPGGDRWAQLVDQVVDLLLSEVARADP